jgi:hypothetical protein
LLAKPKKVRGAPSVRLQRAIDQVEEEDSSDTIARLRRSINGHAIIARLMGHIMETVDMSATQVHAAQVLLRKIIPDLNSVEVSAQPDDRPSVARTPLPMQTADQWERHIAVWHASPTTRNRTKTHQRLDSVRARYQGISRHQRPQSQAWSSREDRHGIDARHNHDGRNGRNGTHGYRKNKQTYD